MAKLVCIKENASDTLRKLGSRPRRSLSIGSAPSLGNRRQFRPIYRKTQAKTVRSCCRIRVFSYGIWQATCVRAQYLGGRAVALLFKLSRHKMSLGQDTKHMPPTTVDGFYEAWRVAPTKSRLIALALLVSTLLPPAYLFVMIQYGAITLPLGDHFATAKLIIKYFDGSLTFRDLLEPQAQARPLFPRLIFIANAALTNWDIRSEYYFIFLTVYGTLAALIFSLLTITQRQSKTYVLLAALLISIVVCSPVAAMNHWWSLMLLATLSYMCALMAFLLFSIAPMSRRW